MKYHVGALLNFIFPGMGWILYGNLVEGILTAIVYSIFLVLSITFFGQEISILFIILSFAIWLYSVMSINTIEEKSK